MIGREYMEEVLWLRNERDIGQTSECIRKFEKNFWGSHKLLQAHKKVCDENKS